MKTKRKTTRARELMGDLGGTDDEAAAGLGILDVELVMPGGGEVCPGRPMRLPPGGSCYLGANPTR